MKSNSVRLEFNCNEDCTTSRNKNAATKTINSLMILYKLFINQCIFALYNVTVKNKKSSLKYYKRFKNVHLDKNRMKICILFEY